MFAAISDRLQNPTDEAERISAFAELREYVAQNPTDTDALNLWDKYSRRLDGTDWSKQTVSQRP